MPDDRGLNHPQVVASATAQRRRMYVMTLILRSQLQMLEREHPSLQKFDVLIKGPSWEKYVGPFYDRQPVAGDSGGSSDTAVGQRPHLEGSGAGPFTGSCHRVFESL